MAEQRGGTSSQSTARSTAQHVAAAVFATWSKATTAQTLKRQHHVEVLCEETPADGFSRNAAAQGNVHMVEKIIDRGIKSLTANSVIISRDAWLRVRR